MPQDDAPTGEAPGAAWFQRIADDGGLVFFILRTRPDVAFEFVNGGMRTQLVGRRPDSSPASWLAGADAALHQAKRAGRNAVAGFVTPGSGTAG